MNTLATFLILAALGSTALPARAIEPVRQPAGATGPVTYSQSRDLSVPARPDSPPSRSNVEGDPAAQVEPPGGPPAGALSLSQIISQIESRPDFAFIRDIGWGDGRYLVIYRTRDGRDRDLKIDPRTGRPQEGHLPVPHWPGNESRS
jgi:hypothetical protein